MAANQVIDLHLSIIETAQDFLLDLEIGNRAPGTIANYRYTVRDLGQFAQRNGWPAIAGINKGHLRQYMAELKKRPRWFGQRDCAGRPVSESYFETPVSPP